MKSSPKKIVVAKGFVNAKNICQHTNFNIIKSGFYNYLICRSCGRNMGEVDDFQQPNK
jgi:hypothetical protein